MKDEAKEEARHHRRVISLMVSVITAVVACLISFWSTGDKSLSVIVLAFMVANNSLIMAIMDEGKD